MLVVEEERFHVHRSILGMWSEVFTTMFTAKFREKTAKEVPLPGKKSAEIKELLLVIHPTSTKPIDHSNFAFFLDLAVRDKSNLKIGHESYPKTVRFFDRDLSTGHVTSFSM